MTGIPQWFIPLHRLTGVFVCVPRHTDCPNWRGIIIHWERGAECATATRSFAVARVTSRRAAEGIVPARTINPMEINLLMYVSGGAREQGSAGRNTICLVREAPRPSLAPMLRRGALRSS